MTKKNLTEFAQWLDAKQGPPHTLQTAIDHLTISEPDQDKEVAILNWLRDIYPRAYLDTRTREFILDRGGEKTILIGQNPETKEFVAIAKASAKETKQQQKVVKILNESPSSKTLKILGQANDHTDQERTYSILPLYGQNLDTYLDKNNPTEHKRLQLCLQMCKIIKVHHSLGIFLGDIKTANIVRPLQRANHELTYIDFDQSLPLQEANTLKAITGNAMSLWYKLPEIVKQKKTTPELLQFADTFSTAATILEILITEKNLKLNTRMIIQIMQNLAVNNFENPSTAILRWKQEHITRLNAYEKSLKNGASDDISLHEYQTLINILRHILNSNTNLTIDDLIRALETTLSANSTILPHLPTSF